MRAAMRELRPRDREDQRAMFYLLGLAVLGAAVQTICASYLATLVLGIPGWIAALAVGAYEVGYLHGRLRAFDNDLREEQR
jgi:hypothetical protein